MGKTLIAFFSRADENYFGGVFLMRPRKALATYTFLNTLIVKRAEMLQILRRVWFRFIRIPVAPSKVD